MTERLSVNINDECADALRRVKAARGIDTTEAIRRAISLLDYFEKAEGIAVNHPDQAAVIASWLSGRGGVFGPPYDDDAEGLIRALYRAGFVIVVNNGEGEIASQPVQAEDDHLSGWDAARFYWHFRWRPDHAETVWHDYKANVTRCACGKTWGAR